MIILKYLQSVKNILVVMSVNFLTGLRMNLHLILDTIKYEDELLNETTLKWFSKNKRTLESPDVKTIINSPENGLDLKLFIIKDDAEGGDFYYLGDLTIVPSTVEELVRPLESGNESIVTMNFKLDNPIPDTLYRYITNK